MSVPSTTFPNKIHKISHSVVNKNGEMGPEIQVDRTSAPAIPTIDNEKVHWLQDYLSKPVVVSSANFSIDIPKLLGWLDSVMRNYKAPIEQIILKSPSCHALLEPGLMPEQSPQGIEIEIHIPTIDKLEKTMGILRDHLTFLAKMHQFDQRDAFMKTITSVWEMQGGLDQPDYCFQATFGNASHPLTLKFIKKQKPPLFDCDSLQVSILPLVHWMNDQKTPAPPPIGLAAIGNDLTQAYEDYKEKKIRLTPQTTCDIGVWGQACQRLSRGFFFADAATYQAVTKGLGTHQEEVLFAYLQNVLNEAFPILFEMKKEGIPLPVIFSLIQCAYLLHGEEENLFAIRNLEETPWLIYHGMALCPLDSQKALECAKAALTPTQEGLVERYLLSVIPSSKLNFGAITPALQSHAKRLLRQKGLAHFLGTYFSLYIFEETNDKDVLLDLLHYAPKLKRQERFAPLVMRLEAAIDASPYTNENKALLAANTTSASRALERFGVSPNANVAQWAYDRWKTEIKTKETISLFIPHHPQIAWCALFKQIERVSEYTQQADTLLKHCLDSLSISSIPRGILERNSQILKTKIRVATKGKKVIKPCPQNALQFLVQAIKELEKRKKIESAHNLFVHCITKKLILPNHSEARGLWLTLCQAHVTADNLEKSVSLFESGDRTWKEKKCHQLTAFLLNLTAILGHQNNKKEERFYQILQQQRVENGLLPDFHKYLRERLKACLVQKKWRKACQFFYDLQAKKAGSETLRADGILLMNQLVQAENGWGHANAMINMPRFQELFSDSQDVIVRWANILLKNSYSTETGPQAVITRLQISPKLDPETAENLVELLHHHTQLPDNCKKALRDHHQAIVTELNTPQKARFLHGLDIHNLDIPMDRETVVDYLQVPQTDAHSRRAACHVLLEPQSAARAHLTAAELPAILKLLQGVTTDYSLEILDSFKHEFVVDEAKKQIMTQATSVATVDVAAGLLINHHDLIYQEIAAVTALRFDGPETVLSLMTLYQLQNDEVWLHLLKLVCDGKGSAVVTQAICNTFLSYPKQETELWGMLRTAMTHHPYDKIWEVFDKTDDPKPQFIAACMQQAHVECPTILQLNRLLALDAQNQERTVDEKESAIKLHLKSNDETLFCSGCAQLHELGNSASSTNLALTAVRYGSSYASQAVEQIISAVLDSSFLSELTKQQSLMLTSLLSSYKNPKRLIQAINLLTFNQCKTTESVFPLYTSSLNKLASIVVANGSGIDFTVVNCCFALDTDTHGISKETWRKFLRKHLTLGLAGSPSEHLASIQFFISHYHKIREKTFHKELSCVTLALASMAQLIKDEQNIRSFSEIVISFLDRAIEELPGHKKGKNLPKPKDDELQIVCIAMRDRPKKLKKSQLENWKQAENKYVYYLCLLLSHTHKLKRISVGTQETVNSFSAINFDNLLRYYNTHTLFILEAIETFITEIDPREESLFEFRRKKVIAFLNAVKFEQNPYRWLVNQYLFYLNLRLIIAPMKFRDPITHEVRTIQPVQEMVIFLQKIVKKGPGHISRALSMVHSVQRQLIDINPHLMIACYGTIAEWMKKHYFEKGMQATLCYEFFNALEIPQHNRLVCANGDQECQGALYTLIADVFRNILSALKTRPNVIIKRDIISETPVEFLSSVLGALLEKKGFQYHYLEYFQLLQELIEYTKTSTKEKIILNMYNGDFINLVELNDLRIELNEKEKEAQANLRNSLKFPISIKLDT